MAKNTNSANVHHMSLPPDMEDDAAPANPDGGGADGPSKPPARQKRKKKVDAGKLQTLMRNWALQYCSQIAWDTDTRQPYAVAGLRNQFGNDEVRMWIASEKRRTVRAEEVVFDPTAACGPNCINLYGGLEMVPIKGQFQPIVELLEHLCNGDIGVRDWVIDWVAWPLQNPGAKIPTSIIMHGDEGSGKNLFWEIITAIYGEYASVVGQDQLEDKFNDYLSRKLLIIFDEVLSRQEMRHLKGKLKAMISGKTIQINTKMMPVRTEANHVNTVFLSNELQPNALDSSDRRYCVIWTPEKREQAFYQDVVKCLAAGGREAFLHWLLERDLSRFDPYAPPPVTTAKTNLIDLSRPNPERWYLEWSQGHLSVPYHSCSSAQAFRLYRRWCQIEGEKYPMSNNVFGRMVMRMVMRMARDAFSVRVVKIKLTGTVRMWMVTPPPEGLDVGAWAAETVDSFEQLLKEYIGDVSPKP